MKIILVFNALPYASLTPTSPPGSVTNGATSGGIARGFNVAAAQLSAAQQAFETAALYASVSGEPFPAIYPTIHHQNTQIPHSFPKV